MTQTKRTWKLVAVLVAALALAGALLTGCSGNSNSSSANYRTLDQIKDSGKITIGVFSDKSPFGYVDENGNYQMDMRENGGPAEGYATRDCLLPDERNTVEIDLTYPESE